MSREPLYKRSRIDLGREMAGWSPEIANEFIRLGKAEGVFFTQMQLQKLVYIAHGWNLAINEEPLTHDAPQAWDYGPVYRELWQALRPYGRAPVTREITNGEYAPGCFAEDLGAASHAELASREREVIDRVYRDYGKFHAYQLSALTHMNGTPWTSIYKGGEGKFDEIPSQMIRDHFVELTRTRRAKAHA